MKLLLPVLFAILCWTASLTPAVWSYNRVDELPKVRVELDALEHSIIWNDKFVYDVGSFIQLVFTYDIENGDRWQLIEVVYQLNSVPLGKFAYLDSNGSKQEGIWQNSDQLDQNMALNVYPKSDPIWDMQTSVWIQPLSKQTGNYSCIFWLGTGTKKEAKFVSNVKQILVKEEKESIWDRGFPNNDLH